MNSHDSATFDAPECFAAKREDIEALIEAVLEKDYAPSCDDCAFVTDCPLRSAFSEKHTRALTL